MIKSHHVLIQPEPGALHVTELLVIDNPTSTTYVGQSKDQAVEPVTLQLSIPPDFDRTTFQKEFYGRRFSIAGDKLVTSIPWTPGQRELKFTYTLGNNAGYRHWDRTVDLPCHHVRVRIEHDDPSQVACTLERAAGTKKNELVFESREAILPVGHRIRVELGQLPLMPMAYAKWTALAVLVGLVLVTLVLVVRKKRRSMSRKGKPRLATRAARGPFPHAAKTPTTRRKVRSNRRRRAG
ncbi:MAG: hypothetical protein ACQESR_03230 [Planctomycetota bacterium]